MAADNSKLNVVAIGASAGGVEAPKDFVSACRQTFPARFWWSCIYRPGRPACWPTSWTAKRHYRPLRAVDGEPLQAGTIRVAVPNRHLLVDGNRIVLSEGPTEDGHRPAVNSLFRSVALSFGRRAVGVLLSGVLDDGTLGSAAIRSRGGTTIAQAPDEALFPAMPLNAIQAGVIDHEVNAAEMGGLLEQLANRDFEQSQM